MVQDEAKGRFHRTVLHFRLNFILFPVEIRLDHIDVQLQRAFS